MKRNLTFIILALSIVSAHAEEPQPAPTQANCELRLVTNAGAGQVFMSIFTPDEQSCLSKSDQTVEAKFKSEQGHVISKRGGAGPQP